MRKLLARLRRGSVRLARADVAAALERAAAFRDRHVRALAAAVAVLALGSVLLALGLDGSGSPGVATAGSRSSQATRDLHRSFGDEPIVVLVKGNRDQGRLPALLLTEDLRRMLGLEGCLSGNLPRGGKSPAPVCTQFAQSKPIQIVYGPGTFINESARQIALRFDAERKRGLAEGEAAAVAARKVAAAQGKTPAEQDRLSAQARELALAQSFRSALGLALKFGLPRVPQLNDPDFVLKLVFEPSLGFATPKPRFAYLFPTDQTALIQARLRPGLSDSERRRAVELVREATASKAFRLERGRYLVSGAPVVEQAVADDIGGWVWPLLVASVLLVAAALLLSRVRGRLLPLAPALAGAALTYGLMSLFGASLTFGTLAVLPLVVALGAAATLLLRWAFGDLRGRAGAFAAAVAAVELGLLALLTSPAPIVKQLGGFSALGLALAIACALALLPLRQPDRRPSRSPRSAPALAGRTWMGVMRAATGRPGRVLAVAAAIAVGGWVASANTNVEASLQRLAPSDTGAVRDARTVARQTGLDGDAVVVVRSSRLTSPAVLRWMSGYQRRILSRHGYRDDRRCQDAELCPGLSLTSLIGGPRTPAQVRRELRLLPRYYSRAVLSNDRRTTIITFRVRSGPASEQQDLVADMRSQLDPPAGVSAQVAGPAVVSGGSSSELGSTWLAFTVLVLAALVVLLLLTTGSARLASALAAPALLASGWSGLVLFLLPVPVNPLSTATVALAMALTGALSAAAAPAYRAERRSGAVPAAALATSYSGLRAPLAAAGLVVVAGLAAPIVSVAPALHDFGIAAAVDVAVTLLAAAIVLPAALVWSEQSRTLRLPRSRAEALAAVRAATAAVRAGLGRAARTARRARLRARLPKRRASRRPSVEP